MEKTPKDENQSTNEYKTLIEKIDNLKKLVEQNDNNLRDIFRLWLDTKPEVKQKLIKDLNNERKVVNSD